MTDHRQAAYAALRALLAERDALTTHRGYVTCARCGHQNGFLEADLAAEVERRAAAAYAERDAAQAEVARLRTALEGCVMAHQTGSYDATLAAYEDAKVALGMVPDPGCDLAPEAPHD